MTPPPRVPTLQDLPPDARARVQSELLPGERLAWAAQPVPRLYARGGWAISIFGVFFGGFALFWIAAAGGMAWFAHEAAGPAGGVVSCFPLFGIPFLLVGLGMLTAPVWMRKAAARTVYAITDRRAIICRGKALGGVEVSSFQPADLQTLTRVERADGGGDLVFRETVHTSYDSDGDRRTTRTRVGFIGVAGVREVEAVLRQTLLAGGAGTRPT